MRYLNHHRNILRTLRPLILAAALLACGTKAAYGQAGAMIVDDPRHIQTTIGEGVQRMEEWKSSYGNSLETLQVIQNMLKEAGIQTDILTTNQIITNISKAAPYILAYTDYARELLRATSTAEQAINMTYRLVSDKTIGYDDALYIIKSDAEYLTRLMKQYKLNKNIYDILRDDTINNMDKLRRIQMAKDTASVYTRFFQNQIRRLENKKVQKMENEVMAETFGKMDSWSPVQNTNPPGLNGIPARLSKNNGSNGNYSDIYPYYKTKQEWDSTVKNIMDDGSLTNAEAATADLSKAKKNILRIVELVIMMLAMGYTAVGFVRITKAEAQSKDVLLKIAIGVILAAIAIAVLESDIVGKISII